MVTVADCYIFYCKVSEKCCGCTWSLTPGSIPQNWYFRQRRSADRSPRCGLLEIRLGKCYTVLTQLVVPKRIRERYGCLVNVEQINKTVGLAPCLPNKVTLSHQHPTVSTSVRWNQRLLTTVIHHWINLLKEGGDRRNMRHIEGNANVVILKDLPVKGLAGRRLSVWGPELHTTTPYTLYTCIQYT
jgi:hypothetical protein